MPKDLESIDTINNICHLKAVPRMRLQPCLHFEVDATQINMMHLHSETNLHPPFQGIILSKCTLITFNLLS